MVNDNSLGMLIGGDWVRPDSGPRIDIRNPARPGEVVGSVPRGDAGDGDRAVEAAQQALRSWRRTTPEERAAAMVAAADRLQILMDSVPALLTREMGKVLWESAFDLGFAEYSLRYFAGIGPQALAARVVDDEYGRVTVERRPVGVVAAIVPWNWPVGLLFVKISQALVAGNTVVCLPSPYAPLAVLRTIAAVQDCFPPGVVNVVTGYGPEIGETLTTHPTVRRVAFTGGIETGRAVLRAASATIKDTTLELGGNDPAILLDDVVVDDTLGRSLVGAAFATSGQLCFAVKRVYAARPVYDAVVDVVRAAADELVVGDGLDPATTMGPLVNDAQLKRVQAMLDDARYRGGRVDQVGTLNPGTDPQGYFLRPHIITGVGDDAPVVSDEQFGPALPIMPFDSDDEAVERANATPFGLKSSVWSADPERAHTVARQIEAGTTFVNQHGLFAVDISAPMGGVKESGLGRDLGPWGVEAYTELHQINDRHVPPPAS